jgi:hypothetical protein
MLNSVTCSYRKATPRPLSIHNCQSHLNLFSRALSRAWCLVPIPPSSCFSSLKLPSTIPTHSSMTSVLTLHVPSTTPSRFMISLTLAQRRFHISSFFLCGVPASAPPPPPAAGSPPLDPVAAPVVQRAATTGYEVKPRRGGDGRKNVGHSR